ncbi:MAG: Rpn family recombination-promoting nuclease/putative transposase [Amoebophilaceae bacterium]|nr:Rpn family recombination-promoting nuclease/putative transposase [Amoebophilaceae bacterium]
MIERFLDPKNDFAFKKIFGTKKNKDILIHFLNDVLVLPDHAKVKNVVFLPNVQYPEIASKKESIVDIICTDHLGRKHIVEMQVAKNKGFQKRAQYYAAKAYSGQINKGEAYSTLKEVIFLAIANFVMFPDKTSYKSDHIILDKETYAQDLKDFSFTFLALPKFKKLIMKPFMNLFNINFNPIINPKRFFHLGIAASLLTMSSCGQHGNSLGMKDTLVAVLPGMNCQPDHKPLQTLAERLLNGYELLRNSVPALRATLPDPAGLRANLRDTDGVVHIDSQTALANLGSNTAVVSYKNQSHDTGLDFNGIPLTEAPCILEYADMHQILNVYIEDPDTALEMCRPQN